MHTHTCMDFPVLAAFSLRKNCQVKAFVTKIGRLVRTAQGLAPSIRDYDWRPRHTAIRGQATGIHMIPVGIIIIWVSGSSSATAAGSHPPRRRQGVITRDCGSREARRIVICDASLDSSFSRRSFDSILFLAFVAFVYLRVPWMPQRSSLASCW